MAAEETVCPPIRLTTREVRALFHAACLARGHAELAAQTAARLGANSQTAALADRWHTNARELYQQADLLERLMARALGLDWPEGDDTYEEGGST